MRYWTGIGSRESPPEILTLCTEIAKFLQKQIYVFRRAKTVHRAVGQMVRRDFFTGKDQFVEDRADEKLAARRKTEVNEAQIIAMSIMNLKQIQIEAEQQYRAQQGCEMRGHSRENGHGSALVGQRDNFHNLILVCQRCQKIFQGIGGAVGQLPLHLANSLDTTLIGGVQ